MPLALAAPAPSPHRVEVSVTGCAQAALELDRVVELLSVELSAFDVEVVAAQPSPAAVQPKESSSAPPTLRVTLAAGADLTDPGAPCESGGTDVTVRVERAASTAPAARRRLETSDVAPANRARTLAIAAAELLQATWLNPASSPGTGVSAPPAAPTRVNRDAKVSPLANSSTAAAQPTRKRAPGVFIEAGVLGRAFPSGGTALLGPELRLSVPLISVLMLNLSGELGSGVASLAFGNADGAASSALANTATFSFGPSVRSPGAVSLEVGPRLMVGRGSLASRTGSPQSDDTLVLVSFDAVVRARLLAGWASFAGIEVGRTLSGVSLESGESPLTYSSIELDGVLIGARIGLSYALTER